MVWRALLLMLAMGACWTTTLGQVVPSEAMLRWSSFEMGAMISWNIDTMDGIQGCNVGMSALPEPKLFDSAQHVDFDSWAQAMKSAGIKYCVLTVKHGCGFTLWPSKVSGIHGLPAYNYTIQSNPTFAHRDLVAEYVAAMKKHDILPGFYYSLGSNVYLGVSGGKTRPPGTKPIPGQVILDQDSYYEVVYQHMIELLSTYPNVSEIWYDGGVPAPIKDRLVAAYKKYASETIVFQGFGVTPNAVRWVGTESGHPKQDMWSTTDAYGDPNVNGDHWYPAECDTPLQNGDTWFFNKNVGARSLTEMKSVYHDTVGNNCNLMLNLAPDPTGTVHYLQTYSALGDFISTCYPSNISQYPAHGTQLKPSSSGVFTLTATTPTSVDRVIIMEDQRRGECVLAYTVRIYAHDGTLAASVPGQWIGHKRIVLLPKTFAEVSRVEVAVTKQRANCAPGLDLLAVTQCAAF